MKKLLLLLLTLSCSNLIFAQSLDDTAAFRVKGIFVSEIFDGGDEGYGTTAEIALFVAASEDFLQVIGLEVGHIHSDIKETGASDGFGPIDAEIDTDLIPVFVNFAIQGEFEDADFIWEIGIGVGGIFAEVDATITGGGSGSDDDFVLGGQVFGRVGYEIADAVQLYTGVRYMLSEDIDFFGVALEDTLNTVAFDLGLSFVF